jgi:hypothetical protein
MPFRTTGSIVHNLTRSVRNLVKDLTGLKLGKRVSNITGGTLKHLGSFSKKIPLAGGIFAYVFKHSSKGVTIVLTSADGLVSKTGKVVNNVVKGASDIAVYSLNTVSKTIGISTKKRGGRKSRRRRRGGRKSRRRRRTRRRR